MSGKGKDSDLETSARLLAREAAVVIKREGITDIGAALEFLCLTSIAAFHRRIVSDAKRSSSDFDE